MSDQNQTAEETVFPCAMRAWNEHEQALLLWLLKETRDRDLAQDLVQELFIRVMQQRAAFCQVENSKAWLFRVARNLLIDQVRRQRYQPLEAEVAEEELQYDAVDLLALSCLPRVLSELEPSDREVLTACDLQGMNQQAFAVQHGLSLPAVKSRLRRARERLKQQIQTACQVKLDENQQVCSFVPRERLS
jgi:RNA polymerase sigma-70 factor (ECF subfamily)